MGFFSLFLNPWFMVLGGALIAAPIIIHLINRMRFRRLRWAAMEFLLKSQKRNRRRLIIEQLILLALRCLLVLLAGLLVARFIINATEGAATQHLAVLDDSLSLTDRWKEQGVEKTSFDVSKQAVREIAKKYAAANSAQQLKVVLLSDPERVLFDERLNSEALQKLNTVLEDPDLKPTALHQKPHEALRVMAKALEEGQPGAHVLHFVSDFRQRDWGGSESDRIAQELDALTKAGVEVSLVDTADPKRTETRQVTSSHDNRAIVELRPESRVVPQDIPTQFTVTVQNFSSSELKNVRVTIKVDGEERPEGSLTMLSVPPGRHSETFNVGFNRPGFAQITANLENEEVGLQGDNIRYAVVEVRPQVPILVVDGDGLAGSKRGEGGGTFFLQMVFSAAKGYRIETGTVNDLANGFHLERVEGREVRRSLDEYPVIFLLNVPELNEKGQQNLDKFAQDGGGVAFFLGDKVKPAWYNQLHKGGEGMFPMPLTTDRLPPPLTAEQKFERAFDGQPKMFVRDTSHPMFAEIYKEDTKGSVNEFFKYLLVDQHYSVPRRKWNKTDKHDELITLPNRNSIENYRQETQEMLAGLPLKESKYEAFHPGLEKHQRIIRNGLAPGGVFAQLYQLEAAINNLLTDTGKDKDAQQPNLRDEFWKLPEMESYRKQLEQFRERLKFGEPLMVGHRYGKGRVVACTTTAGSKWNDWPGGPAGPSYVVFILALQKYLASVGDDVNRVVGSPLTLQLAADRFEPKMHRYYVTEPKPNVPESERAKSSLQDLGEQLGASGAKEVELTFTEAKKPGVYYFDLYPRAEAGVEPKPERRAYAFNVDAEAEGDLKRAAREALEWSPGGSDTAQGRGHVKIDTIESIESTKLARQSDWSEFPWLYLIILVVLVLEQAMAVHLSFHLKGNEAQLPQQAARSEMPAAA